MFAMDLDFKSSHLYIGSLAGLNTSIHRRTGATAASVSDGNGVCLRIAPGPIGLAASTTEPTAEQLPSENPSGGVAPEVLFTQGSGRAHCQATPEFPQAAFLIADIDEQNYFRLEVLSPDSVLKWRWFAENGLVYQVWVWSNEFKL